MSQYYTSCEVFIITGFHTVGKLAFAVVGLFTTAVMNKSICLSVTAIIN